MASGEAPPSTNEFQSALRFAVVSDKKIIEQLTEGENKFQSALRFAVVSDRSFKG